LSSLKDLESIIFYCAGYVSRSLLKTNKCDKCKDLLVQADKETPSVEFADDCSSSTKESFLDAVNRGGLVYPSELVFLTTLFAVKLRQEIFVESEIRSLFMQFQNPCDVFVKCLEKRISASTKMNDLLSQTCENEHSFLRLTSVIARKAFNFTAKNFSCAINDTVHDNRKRGNQSQSGSNNRKVTKLSSN